MNRPHTKSESQRTLITFDRLHTETILTTDELETLLLSCKTKAEATRLIEGYLGCKGYGLIRFPDDDGIFQQAYDMVADRQLREPSNALIIPSQPGYGIRHGRRRLIP